jgi:hypothetical protein
MVITRGDPVPDDDDDGFGNPVFRIPLSEEPDDEWTGLFDTAQMQSGLNIPHVIGDGIEVTVPKSGSLVDHLANIDERIKIANKGLKSTE